MAIDQAEFNAAMATYLAANDHTIALRRGAEASLPSGLLQGELYYNTDDRNLYAGHGDATAVRIDTYAGPVGEIKMWPAGAAPTKYLLCDGAAVSRTTYADLFALISTTYGVGDNSTTFNLPNLKGKVVVGYNSAETEFDALGDTGGEKTHTLTKAELAEHIHAQQYKTGTPGSGANYYAVPTGGVAAAAFEDQAFGATNVPTQSTGSGTAHNNLQPYLVMNYIIRALA